MAKPIPHVDGSEFLATGFQVSDETRKRFKRWVQQHSPTYRKNYKGAPSPGTPIELKPLTHSLPKISKYVHVPLKKHKILPYNKVLLRLLREGDSRFMAWAATDKQARAVAKKHGIVLPSPRKSALSGKEG